MEPLTPATEDQTVSPRFRVCPFCGNGNVMCFWMQPHLCEPRCRRCGTRGPTSATREEAAAQWNQRSAAQGTEV